jgi:hypothetical protein
MPRDMTGDELKQFEEKEIHHADESEAESGPASEAEIVRDIERSRQDAEPAVLPPNPD